MLSQYCDNKQESWKAPLPQFLEEIYFKRFKKETPDEIKPLAQIIKERKIKDEKAKKEKQKRRALQASESNTTEDTSTIEITMPDN